MWGGHVGGGVWGACACMQACVCVCTVISHRQVTDGQCSDGTRMRTQLSDEGHLIEVPKNAGCIGRARHNNSVRL